MTHAAPPTSPTVSMLSTNPSLGASGGPALLRRRPGLGNRNAFSVAAIVIVVAFGLLVAKTGPMTRLDLAGVQALNTLHIGFVGAVGSGVYAAFSPIEAVSITVVIVGVIALATRDLRLAGTFALTVAVTWISSDVVKLIVQRPRPDASAFANHLGVAEVDPSYPSGHMAFIATLALTFYLLAAGKSYRPAVAAVGMVAVAVVALSLVSDGVHYPSDVIASIAWSLAVAPGVVAASNRFLLPLTYRSATRRAAHPTDRTAAHRENA